MQPIFHKPHKPVKMLQHDLAAIGMGMASRRFRLTRRIGIRRKLVANLSRRVWNMSELKWLFWMMKVDVLFLAAINRHLPRQDEGSESFLV